MTELPVTGAIAEYRGKRLRILFGGDGWLALEAAGEVEMPDAFARGQRGTFPEGSEQWVKVPRSVIDGVVDVRVRGSLRGHTVSLQERLSDGQFRSSSSALLA